MNDATGLLALLEPSAGQRHSAAAEAPPHWLQAVADAVQQADPTLLVATGFLGHAGDRIGGRRVLAAGGSGAPDGLWTLHLSPLLSHRALAWLPDSADPWCTQVWMDAHALPWPGERAGPGALLPGHWADDNTWALPFAPEHHPLQDWSRNLGLGTQRGLWVIEAGTGTTRLLLPLPHQLWRDPQLMPDGDGSGWQVQPQPGLAPFKLLA